MNNRTVHEFLKRLTSVLSVRIKAGPLKGRKWIFSTGRNFLRGQYEVEKTEGIVRTISEDDIVFDIGAHVGYYTLIMAQIAGPRGHVFAFEPRKLNRDFLKKHIRLNDFTNVTVFPYCVGDTRRTVHFETRTGTGTGHVSDEGDISVEMISIDDAVEEGLLRAPSAIKLDVEGAENLVLDGAMKTIAAHKPKMILAVHSDQLEAYCRNKLEPLGYTFEDLGQEKGDKEFIVTPS